MHRKINLLIFFLTHLNLKETPLLGFLFLQTAVECIPWDSDASAQPIDLSRQILEMLVTNPAIDINYTPDDKEIMFYYSLCDSALYHACKYGKIEAVRILLAKPELKICITEEFFSSWVSANEELEKIIDILLADHRCDLNPQGTASAQVLNKACQKNECKKIIESLLLDSRININELDQYGLAPITTALVSNSKEIGELLLLAPVLDINILLKRVNLFDCLYDYNAMYTQWNDASDLSTACFIQNEVGRWVKDERLFHDYLTENILNGRYWVKHKEFIQKLYPQWFPTGLCATTVFLCDDFLRLKSNPQEEKEVLAIRFLTIASKLPMELQMVLCHRFYDSAKENILSRDSEIAFKNLARQLSYAQ